MPTLVFKDLSIWRQVVWIFLFVYYIFSEKIAASIDQAAMPHNNIYLKKRIIKIRGTVGNTRRHNVFIEIFSWIPLGLKLSTKNLYTFLKRTFFSYVAYFDQKIHFYNFYNIFHD